MNSELFPMIFKRKSFHLFRNVGEDKISEAELKDIEDAFPKFEALYPDIKTAIRIVKPGAVSFKRDAEYCILIYSEKKDNYLMNAGFIGQQLDLYLVSKNIGSLWFGIGKPDEKTHEGLDFVIMIAIRKVKDDSLFRKDMYKAKRKPLEEQWSGDDLGIADIARFSPSACNTQPWFVENSGDKLTVYRYKKDGKRGIMPAAVTDYYNRIDIGIYLCILEICMAEKKISAERKLFIDKLQENREFTRVAEYLFA